MNWDNFKAFEVIKGMSVLLLSILIIGSFGADKVSAHSPHDVVLDVELSPDFQSDRTAYALLDGYLPIWGNLFKSQDGGESWTRIEGGLDNRHELASVAVSTDSKEILYLSSLGDGIYKSTDEGTSWVKTNRGLNNLSIDLLAIAPDSPDVVLAAGQDAGLYLTEDGGDSWSSVIEESKITAIAFNSKNAEVVVGDAAGNLYSSRDRGENWRKLAALNVSGAISALAISPNHEIDRTIWVGTSKGLWQTVDGGANFVRATDGIGEVEIMSLAVSPNYELDSTILAATWHEGIYRSTDDGRTWKQYTRGLKKHSQADTTLYKSPHFSDLSISASFELDGTLLLAGFDGVFKSTNGGVSWRDVNLGKGAVSIRNLAVSPNYQQDGTVAFSTIYQGVYLSRDRGTTWTPINQGLGTNRLLKQQLIAETGDLIFSPNYGSDRTILASSWGGVSKTTNGGKLWHKFWVPKRLRRDSYLAVSPNFQRDRTFFLATLPGKILQSTDDGQSFTVAGDIKQQAAFIPSWAISPNFQRDRTLYLGNFTGGVYKSTDAGATWQLLDGLAVPDNYAKLAISPNYQSDRTVFAGTSRGLLVTQDGGTSWEKLPITAEGDGYIENVALSPDLERDRTLLVSVRGEGLFKSTDCGATFTSVDEYWTGPIVFSPAYGVDRTIFGSSGAELYQSTDGGDTWQTLIVARPDYGLPTMLYHLATNSPQRRYLAASIAALASYLLLGLLGNRKLPLRKWQLKMGGAFTAFIGALSLLSA